MSEDRPEADGPEATQLRTLTSESIMHQLRANRSATTAMGVRVTTIYTDRYGLYPWAMLLLSCSMFWSAYRGFVDGDGNQLGLGVGGGSVFLILAFKRLWDVHQAKRSGRDPSIVRAKKDVR